MKILQLAKYPPNLYGGIEKLASQISTLLYSPVSRVDILCFDQRFKSRFDVFYTHTVYRARTLFVLKSTPFSVHNLYFLRKLFCSYDLIHIHLPNPFAALYALLLPADIPISVHFHAEVRNLRFYTLYRLLEAKLLSRSSKIIATSPQLANSPSLLPYSEKVSVVPLGLTNEDRQLPSASQLDPIYNSLIGSSYFIFVGRFTKYKNIPLLIRAFSLFRSRTGCHCGLYILGSGPASIYNTIIKEFRQSQYQSDILILEDLPDVHKRFLVAHALSLILPSTTIGEAFGFVQLEAMALSTPVISFDIPYSGVPYVNQNLKSGLVLQVPSHDSEIVSSLALAMERLFYDPGLLNELSVGARERSYEFDIGRQMSLLRQLLLAIANDTSVEHG